MAERYVDDLMSRPVETVAPETTVRAAAATLLEHAVGAAVVVDDDGRLAGILTATDVLRLVDAGRSPDTPVEGLMRTDVVTTSRDTPAATVAETMLDRLVHHVPVVEDGRPVGMVTTMDLTAALARRGSGRAG